MNLLRHYIIEVLSEEPVHNPYMFEENVRVVMKIHIDFTYEDKIVDELFTISNWERYKQQGYYLG